jgi:hypothetical protein
MNGWMDGGVVGCVEEKEYYKSLLTKSSLQIIEYFRTTTTALLLLVELHVARTDRQTNDINHSTEEYARGIPFTAPQYTNKRIQ